MITTKSGQQAGKWGTKRDLYNPLGFAVVRAPMLPIEFYHFICNSPWGESSLPELLNNGQVRFALESASPSLMNALLSPSKNEKDRLRARRKLRRYLIRMSTRPTPFGAFAGVAIASLGERTTLRVDEAGARYYKHLDVPWLLEFVHKLESDPEVFRQLRLQVNPCTLMRGGRVYIRELSSLHESGHELKDASLGASHLVMRALAEARAPIIYEHLAASLSTSAQATEEKVQHFVTELWRQGFLFTELRPPFTNGDPAQYVLDRLRGLRGVEDYRLDLERAMAATRIECLSETVSATVSDWKDSVPPGKKQFRAHVDSVLSTSGELSVAVAKEAARAAELLLSLTSWPSGPPHLRAYRRSFEDRYGVDREVPLLELIDPEYGIGFPPGYDRKKPSPGDAPADLRLRRETLFDIALCANDERRLEVELDAEMCLRLRTWTPSFQSAPISLEINVFVSAASIRDLDDGRFTVVVGPNVGAMEAGRSLGRFAGSLGSAGIKAFRDATESCEAISPQEHCVELSYLPRNLKLTNVIVRPRTRRYEIDVGVQPGVPLGQSIPLDELVIGLRDDRFYVRSPRLDGDLNICSGHMANSRYAPLVCRLLSEITFDGVAHLADFDWGMASMLQFLPRVRVGRVVLSVAKWRISADMAQKQLCTGSPEKFRRSLALWRTEWKVPRNVHLAEGDNRLVLDLENEMDVEDLRRELTRLSANRVIMLEEVYPNLEDLWLCGSKGRFVAEYVVPLVLNANGRPDHPSAGPSSVRRAAAASDRATACRIKTPGTDWLYIKLYCASSIEDDLLTGPVRELTRSARESGLIDQWFFIRYADPDTHIRVRFQGSPTTLSQSLLPKVFRWAQALVDKDLCMRFAIDTYEREIERYGGIDSIESAEHLFYLDSESILAMLRFLGKTCPLRRVELAVLGLDFLFQKLGCSSSQQLAFFKDVAAPRNQSGSAYRERKSVLQAIVRSQPDPSVAGMISDISGALEKNGPAISNVGWQLRELHADGRLALPLDAVFRSFAHMHCNRIGLDATTERLAYGLLTRSYETLIASSRRHGNKPRAEYVSSDAGCDTKGIA